MNGVVSPGMTLLHKACADDLDEVMAIMGPAFGTQFGEAWTRAQCAGILPMPGVDLTLAREPGGSACGFALSRTIVDEAELLLIAVAPSAQRRGCGRALLDHFVQSAGERGATRLHLEVRDGNGALGLYQSAGFKLVGRRRNYYRGSDGAQFDALTLVRLLNET